jgi:Tfp pilus assembly protein PilW
VSGRRGFSTIEMLVAMAITTTCAGVMLSLVTAGHAIARTQPARSDQQQRARIAMETLGTELARAGAGLDRGAQAGPLAQYFAPVVVSADNGLTVWYVAAARAQAALAAPFVPGSTDAAIDAGGTCPAADPPCGFEPASSALVFDTTGCHDVVRIDAVMPASIVTRVAPRTCSYAAGAAVAAGEVRTYRVDPATRQLIRRDEATGGSVPVLDQVGGMSIAVLDGGRRVRVSLRFVSTLLEVPELVLALDVAPPNLRERW